MSVAATPTEDYLNVQSILLFQEGQFLRPVGHYRYLSDAVLVVTTSDVFIHVKRVYRLISVRFTFQMFIFKSVQTLFEVLDRKL